MANRDKVRNLKLLCVGDGAVGKSSLFITYTTAAFPSEYVPTVFDNYSAHVMVDGDPVNLALWDTAGQEDYDRLRPLSYPGTSVFIICFSVGNRDSLQNVIDKWQPELEKFNTDRAPILLVACKTDLRHDEVHNPDIVKYEEGRAVADKLGLAYHETSSLTQTGVRDCMENAIRLVLNAEKTSKKRKGKLIPQPPVMPAAGKAPWLEVETSTYADDYHKLLKSPRHSDVTFVINGAPELNGHKMVLCAASSFFSRLLGVTSHHTTNQLSDIKKGITFTTEDISAGRVEGIAAVNNTERPNNTSHTTVELSHDILPTTFVHILEFLYTGVPDLPSEMSEEELSDLIRVADIFGLTELKTICLNVQTEQDILNPSIGTFLNDETGRKLKEMFFNKHNLADVIFEVEGTCIFAHKAVLCARCEVMEVMLSGSFCESKNAISRIPIIGTDSESFLAFLEYLYTDHSPIEESDSLGILSLADEYGQSRLVNLCELYVTKEVDRSCSRNIEKADIDVIGLLNFSDVHNASQLSAWCLHFISSNYEPFSKRPEWEQLDGDNRDHVEKERWPPVDYLNELKEYELKMKKHGEKCSIM